WNFQETLFLFMNTKGRVLKINDSVLTHLSIYKKNLLFLFCFECFFHFPGYYTSRPFYKQADRTLQHALRSAEIAFTLASAEGEDLKDEVGNSHLFPSPTLFIQTFALLV